MATANSTRKPISTELQLKKLKPTGKIYDVKVANTPGLVVRVGKSGTKSYRWDRGSKHKPRIITHGTFPALSLADARTAHQKVRQQHTVGTLTLTRKRREKALQSNGSTPRTVADLAERFYVSQVLKNHKRPESARRVLDADILPVLGEVKLGAVTPVLVSDAIELVVVRAPVYAQRVRGILKQIFDMGVALGLMEINPVASLSAKFLGIESNERDRVLSGSEIKQFWDLPFSAPVSTALKLLLLLGVRSGELRLAKWEHIDFDKGVLTVPVSNQKLKKDQAKKAHGFRVPLDSYAISLLQQQKVLNDSVWVFPGRVGKPMVITTLPQAVRITNSDIEPFTPHDLRRTMRSGLAKLGIKPHVAESCLNHSLGKIQDIYDRYDYLDERREALEKWSQHVQVILGKHDNVILMEVAR